MAVSNKKSTNNADTTLPLADQLVTKRADLIEAKKGLGQTLQNPHTIKNIKKDIARILTQINSTKGEK
jgi:ribosomal protein L29